MVHQETKLLCATYANRFIFLQYLKNVDYTHQAFKNSSEIFLIKTQNRFSIFTMNNLYAQRITLHLSFKFMTKSSSVNSK